MKIVHEIFEATKGGCAMLALAAAFVAVYTLFAFICSTVINAILE